MEPNLLDSVAALDRFAGDRLTDRINALEETFVGCKAADVQRRLASAEVSTELLAAAQLLKRTAAQIHVVIHAVGILLCLPHLLEPGETVESLSLGAGNTGRDFDLETNKRIAEFKFSKWQGGSDTIRQNQVFKDFYYLAEHPTKKRKYLYVIDTEHAQAFFEADRALDSVMSRHRRLWSEFNQRYGTRFSTVSEYFNSARSRVAIVAVGQMLGLVAALVATADGEVQDDG